MTRDELQQSVLLLAEYDRLKSVLSKVTTSNFAMICFGVVDRSGHDHCEKMDPDLARIFLQNRCADIKATLNSMSIFNIDRAVAAPETAAISNEEN